MGIAGVDLLFGLSIFFLVGTDYEDCVIIYPPAIIAVLAGGLLFYGSLYYNKAATMVYLILSMMLIVFFGIASVILFTRFQKMATIIGSIFLFIGLLRTYFWCLVYIFFKSLKKPSDHSLGELIQMGINISQKCFISSINVHVVSSHVYQNVIHRNYDTIRVVLHLINLTIYIVFCVECKLA